MKKRNIYLTTMAMEEALHLYLDSISKVAKRSYEEIEVKDSLNRMTKKSVYAKYCSPLFNAAAMDGIAVISEKTAFASERNPITLIEGADYIEIDTGDPIKAPFDAVIMAENLIGQSETNVTILDSAVPWQHVRPIGEDIVAGEMILPGGHQIRPMDIGVLLSAGVTKIDVAKIPKVGIYPTGTELIEPEHALAGGTPNLGAIIESNSQMFAALITEAGGEAHRFPAVADDYGVLKGTIQKGVDQFDMLILNAGSSAGREDYVVHVLRELGTVLVHGVAMKPGKPVILAIVGNTPVIGLPGYPVSAYLGLETFVLPTLSLLTGREYKELQTIDAVMTRRLVSSLKHKEYIRVKVGKVKDKLVASPLARGAGAAMSLVRADGFCVIDQNQEGVEAGSTVQVKLYRDVDEIKNTLVMIGSHDLILDVLADLLPNQHKNLYLSSTHIGSLGGLMSLGRGEAHMAPIHLLDEETGIYNIPYLERVSREPMALIKGVGRIQGLMVKKGNPKQVKGLADIVRISYVNRQRGSGTRILLDDKLKALGISGDDIAGYDREAATHMAVAALVAGDSADAGMGIRSAARTFGLDFIEVATEEYDFAIPLKFLGMPQVQALIQTLKSNGFKARLDELGGYDDQRIGEVFYL